MIMYFLNWFTGFLWNEKPKRTVLLRALESGIAEAVINEKFLEIFETIEELDKIEGLTIRESMKAAYCAVAVECTVKYMAVGDTYEHGKYFDAVEKIWRVRMTELERRGDSELVTPELKSWKIQLENALCNKKLWEKLMHMNTRYIALKLTQNYLAEGEGENVQGSHRCVEVRAKTIHIEGLEDDSSFGKYDCLNTPEVNQFHFVYSDNFKDSLFPRCEPPESVTHGLAEKNKAHEHLFEDRNDVGAANSTTHCEWNDFIDGSPELHIPSLKQKVISPSEKDGDTKIVRRRKNKKWSLLETETLRDAVLKFGKGNWKIILNNYRDIFEERTGADLKDKWRNINKHS